MSGARQRRTSLVRAVPGTAPPARQPAQVGGCSAARDRRWQNWRRDLASGRLCQAATRSGSRPANAPGPRRAIGRQAGDRRGTHRRSGRDDSGSDALATAAAPRVVHGVGRPASHGVGVAEPPPSAARLIEHQNVARRGRHAATGPAATGPAATGNLGDGPRPAHAKRQDRPARLPRLTGWDPLLAAASRPATTPFVDRRHAASGVVAS